MMHGKKSLKPKTRWEDDVLEDIKSMNVRNWKKVVEKRDSWKKVDKQATTLYRLWRFIRKRDALFFKFVLVKNSVSDRFPVHHQET